MAGEPLDSLDEFFDFAQLERDNYAFDAPIHYESPSHFVPPLGPDAAMDWQPTVPQDIGPFAMPPEFPDSNALSHIVLPEPNKIAPMFSPVHDMPVVPQDVPALPDAWQQHPMPREGDVIVLQQQTAQPSRPQRSNTVIRKPASAKRKGPSTRIPLDAKQMLEEEFAANPYPCSWEIDIIAHQAHLDVKRVRNWFNNTRARKKPESPGPQFVKLIRAPLTLSRNNRGDHVAIEQQQDFAFI